MSSKELNLDLIGRAIGMNGKAVRQKQMFEYVVNSADKSSEELAGEILDKGEETLVTSTAGRIVSNLVYKYHRDLKDADLSQKWNNLFSEEEREYFKEKSHKHPRDCAIEVITDKSRRAEAAFSVKVIRGATAHYLKDIKANGRLETLNPDELDILNQVSEKQEMTDLTQEELRDHQLWEAGYLQCELIRNQR
jgi:hypothetical protein